MDNNPDDFEISDEWEDSIRGRVERNKNKAKYDAKSDDTGNIAAMLFSRSLNGGLLREATDSGISSILQRSPLQAVKKKTEEEEKKKAEEDLARIVAEEMARKVEEAKAR